MTLAERLLALDAALAAAGLPHAFGGAIALAYWTLDPRGTRDLDVNVFVPSKQAPRVLGALPPGATVPDGGADRLAGDGQLRVWWEEDVEAMLAADTLDIAAVRALLAPMLDGEDARWERLSAAERA